VAITFVGAGSLITNATTQALIVSQHTNTLVGDIIFCQVINKSVTANAVTPPDGTWTKLVEATNNAATANHRHQYSLFSKVVTAAGVQTYTFTKATDDNFLLAGVISSWRGSTTLDATALGTTVTTAATDNVSFPAFDPTSTSAHVLYFAYYGLAATTFGTMAGTDPTCTNRYDLESSTGTACSLACTSGDSTGSAITSRTWASASTTDAGNTGVVLALSGGGSTDTTTVTQATVTIAGQTVSTPADTGQPGSGDVLFASTRTRFTARRTLLYRPLTIPGRPPAAVDINPVTQATVTFTGKTVTLVETDIIPVLKASVTVTGKTVTVREADVTPVLKATVTYTGKTVTSIDGDVVPVLKATITVIGKPLTEFGLVPVNKATVTFAGQTVALVDPGVDRVTVDPAAVTVSGQTVTLVDTAPPVVELPFATRSTTISGRKVLLYRSIFRPVETPAPVPEDLPFPQGQTVVLSQQTLLYRPTIEPPVQVTEAVPGLFPQGQTSILARWAFLYPAGTPAPLVTPPGIEIIPVYPATIRFIGQEVTLTGQGEVPIGGGGGVTFPPWIVYGRKHRRRYRALEEIEKRLDERIERLKTETKEKQQQVAEVISQPGQIDVLSQQFADLLLQQALITQALLEAQRRAEAVRQERIQLAILAQRAAEAIDEEEAITMLLLT
jgi:hypothetical protein